MMTRRALLALGLASLLLSLAADARGDGKGGTEAEAERVAAVSIRVLFDNRTRDPELTTGWGLSYLVRAGETTVLFDTGIDGPALLGNMRALGVDPREVDKVFLSHAHKDHTGGLSSFLERQPSAEVHLLESFPQAIKTIIQRSGARLVEHGPLLSEGAAMKPLRIGPGLYTTGALGGAIPEQALVVDTREGPVLLTGCSHPGIGEIVEAVTRAFGRPIALVLGGYHLSKAPRAVMERAIARMKSARVALVAPNHCTGRQAIRMFRLAFGERCLDARAGVSIRLPLRADSTTGAATRDIPLPDP